jgi:hypothetical protein
MKAKEVMRSGRRGARAPLSAAATTELALLEPRPWQTRQDGILRRQTAEHYETDLGIDIIVQMPSPGAKNVGQAVDYKGARDWMSA